MQELLELIKSAKNPREFLEHTKMALYQDKIFLFTEKGKLYSLKKGSTILDFASIIGLVGCLGLVLFGIMKDDVSAIINFLDPTSAMITIGGTMMELHINIH